MSGRDTAFFLRLFEANLSQGETEAAASCLEQALGASPDGTERARITKATERLAGALPTDDDLVTRVRYIAAQAKGLVSEDASEKTSATGRKPSRLEEVSSETLEAVKRLVQEAPTEISLPAVEVITHLLAAGLDVHATARVALDLVVQATGADHGHLVLADAQNTAFGLPDGPARPPETSRGVLAEVERIRQTVVVGDALQDPRFGERASVQELNLRAVLCIPILAHEGPGPVLVGALYLESRTTPGRFGQRECHLGETLAALIGPALWNARRYEEQSQALARAKRLYADARETAIRQEDGPRLLGRSPALHDLLKMIDRVAPTEHTILIEGESGTGKELVARAVHARSERAGGPFVAENMGALAEGLLEAELFGHVRGAFTGASESSPGLFLIADGGTILLDEIGELPLPMQAKLLRVLQEREVRAVGSSGSVKVDVRILAATNRDLMAEVQAGRFREDLYYRLTVIKLRVPPLRERRVDIPVLLEHFLARAAADMNREPPKVSSDLLSKLMTHGWPGNVRELEGYATRYVLTGPQDVESKPQGLSGTARGDKLALDLNLSEDVPLGLREARTQFDRVYLQLVLDRYEGNVSATAKVLGLNRSYLSELVKRYQLRK